MSFDAVGFGALNLDRLCRVKRLAGAGEHEEILKIEEHPGGSAANTIAALARLGLETGFIGAVGKDPEGRIMIEDFDRCGVDTGGISRADDRTGIIIGFVDSVGERTLYPYPGANNLVEYREEYKKYLEGAGFLHLTSFVDERQLCAQERVVEDLPESVRISFSPGILYSRKGLKRLTPFFRRSYVVFLNEKEIMELTGKGYLEGSKTIRDLGAEIVAVTLGGKGCYVLGGDGGSHTEAEKVKVIDTTGAGDAFAAGFLYALIRGMDLAGAARIGNKVAGMCVQGLGARTNLPDKV